MEKYHNKEFYNIIDEILNSLEFQDLKHIHHHGITRFDHCLRVSYFTYCITKKLHLHYREATRGALLHDFFTDEVEEENGIFKLRRHPNCALFNANQLIPLGEIEKDIIKTHMFPITFTPPKYLESWIVDFVDDFSAVYERFTVTKKEIKSALTFLFLLFIHLIK